MKNSTRVTGFLLIFFAFLVLGNVLIARETLSSDFPKTSAPDVKAEYAPDELIVKFKSTVQQDMAAAILTNSVTESSLAELNKKHRVKKATPLFRKRLGKTTNEAVKSFQDMIEKARSARGVPRGGKITDLSNIYVLRVEEGVDILEAVKGYTGDPNVEYAEPNYKVQALTTPDDPLFSNLWGLHNTGQSGGTADADIDAPEAWDIETGSSGVVVAVIDTGVDYTHEDLAANMWTNTGEIPGNGIDDDGNGYIDDDKGWDFYNNDNDPYDDNGHGTHCSGTIAAVGNNGVGITGVNWNLRVMPLKFLGSDGGGYTSDAVTAILYATDMGARVMSNSWGGGGYSQSMEDAIQAANAVGILFIAAAGNGGSDTDISPFYPSGYDVPNVMSVAATDHNDGLASFSNYGATSVDLGAPGVNVYSTIPGNSYGYKSGTSMATPHVAGVAGLVISHNPSLSTAEVKNRVLLSVDPLSSLDGKTLTGGRLNALNALTGPYNPPIANFSAEYDSVPTPPVIVQFTDLSVYAGSPAWRWDFGDGTFSAERNPVHTYTATGKYTVSLTVTDEYGSDTETRTEFILVGMGWMNETVDSAGSVGWYTSLALDASDRPHISYYGYGDLKYAELKYAWYDGAAWQIETVDSAGVVGRFTSLALDASDSPHISYLDQSNGDLKYTYYNIPLPDITASPAFHDFGSVHKKKSSPPATFTISNTGTADLVIGGVYLTGPNPYQFSIQNDNCSGQTIASSGSCTIEAIFSPTKKGTFNALIGIESNDPDTPTLNIELTGTGVMGHKNEGN